MRVATCRVCGKEFETNHSRACFCSAECSRQYHIDYKKKWKPKLPTVSKTWGNRSLELMSPVRRRIELMRRANKEFYDFCGDRAEDGRTRWA